MSLLIERISFRAIKCMLYAAYIAGHMTAGEGKALTHPDSIEERRRLSELLRQEAES